MFPTGSESNKVVFIIHTSLRCADMIFNLIFVIKLEIYAIPLLHIFIFINKFINTIVMGPKFDIVR